MVAALQQLHSVHAGSIAYAPYAKPWQKVVGLSKLAALCFHDGLLGGMQQKAGHCSAAAAAAVQLPVAALYISYRAYAAMLFFIVLD
jgi:hypothetical protein